MSDPTPHEVTDVARPNNTPDPARSAEPAPAAAGIRFPDVRVQLTGRNGNVYVVIGAVAAALRKHVDAQAATAFTDAAFACTSYEQVLGLVMRTVDVA